MIAEDLRDLLDQGCLKQSGWTRSFLEEKSTKPNDSHFRPKSSSELLFDINCPFVFSHLIYIAGYICKRTTLHNLLFTRISVLLHRLILYIKVFWNKLKYMWFCCLHRKIVPLRGHYHYWVCHLESQGGKSAIYYFPLDDSWHGCSINAWGPRYLFLGHLHIYFHCFENEKEGP